MSLKQQFKTRQFPQRETLPLLVLSDDADDDYSIDLFDAVVEPSGAESQSLSQSLSTVRSKVTVITSALTIHYLFQLASPVKSAAARKAYPTQQPSLFANPHQLGQPVRMWAFRAENCFPYNCPFKLGSHIHATTHDYGRQGQGQEESRQESPRPNTRKVDTSPNITCNLTVSHSLQGKVAGKEPRRRSSGGSSSAGGAAGSGGAAGGSGGSAGGAGGSGGGGGGGGNGGDDGDEDKKKKKGRRGKVISVNNRPFT